MEVKLIEFVRSNRFLYDKKQFLYRSQELKDSKWKEFSKEVNLPVNSLKRRWKTMRDRFFRVRKNMRSVAAGSSETCTYKKSYKYYKNLEFLCEVETSNTRVTENFLLPDSNTNLIEESEELMIERDIFFENEVSCPSYVIEDTMSSTSSKASYEDQNSNPIESQMLTTTQIMKSSTTQTVSPFRTFLDSVAQTVEQSNFTLAQQIHIQMKILNILQEVLGNT